METNSRGGAGPDESGISGHYSDGNRAFLQALMSRGSMTFAEAQPVLAAIFTAQEGGTGAEGEDEAVQAGDVTMEDMESYVAAAAAAVWAFDMEVRSMRIQHSAQPGGSSRGTTSTSTTGGASDSGRGRGRKVGDRVWAVVNTTSDGLTQLATLHSAEEIAFVKRVLDAMFEKYNTPRIEAMCLDSMQANKLRIPPPPPEDATMIDEAEDDNNSNEDGGGAATQQQQTLKGLKSSEAEAVMLSMVDEGWFEKTSEGLYMLSSRAILELRSWLVDAYNDPEAEAGEWRRVKHCAACREIVTVGKRCPDRDCHVRIHEICGDAFWRTRKDRKCPKCKTVWPRSEEHKTFIGPKAITETEAYQRGRRRSGKGGGRSSNLVEQIMHEDEEEDGDGDGQGAARGDEDDEDEDEE